MKEILSEINKKLINISGNKNPIKMDLFLSFLTVDVVRSERHMGSDTGWTRFYGDNNLVVRGGIVRGVEYLDDLEYKEKLENRWNNYVNPFHLFDILNDEGKAFFLDYFKDDIARVIKKTTDEKVRLEKDLEKAKEIESDTIALFESFK